MVSTTSRNNTSTHGVRNGFFAHVSSGRVVKMTRFGTTFGIKVMDKTGACRSVPIIPSNKPNKYLALFDTDDVDFLIHVDNRKSRSCHVTFNLDVHNKRYRFVGLKSTHMKLRSLESQGRKLHFLRRSSEDGETYIATFASMRDLTFKQAARTLSQLKFELGYSGPVRDDTMVVTIDSFKEKFDVEVTPTNTINYLKTLIEEFHDIDASEQRLVFKGKVLPDEASMMDSGICDGSVIHLVRMLQGGSKKGDDTPEDEISSDPDSDSGVALPGPMRSSSSSEGERGVIVFGDQSHTIFRPFMCRQADALGRVVRDRTSNGKSVWVFGLKQDYSF
ncbi:unnamed protein product [Allacma fusca]|uniref:Ubiquitin-like domain-containing protein n=1 Tax=Allacma fusca TaxID=39272 RepID=A0A8J2PVV6_9HEXA|nr:unnamed protein product [Allacma fusca]